MHDGQSPAAPGETVQHRSFPAQLPPIVALINDHLGPLLAGESALATEKLYDMMLRLASPYSPSGSPPTRSARSTSPCGI